MNLRTDDERFEDQSYIKELEDELRISNAQLRYEHINGMSPALAKTAAVAETYGDTETLRKTYEMHTDRQLSDWKDTLEKQERETMKAEEEEQPKPIEEEDPFLVGFSMDSKFQYDYRMAMKEKTENAEG